MFLQYFRPQLYSGDTACRIWGHPGFIPEPARCTLRTSGHPWLHSGTRPSAFGDTPGFIPGHGLPHLGTPRLHSGTRPSALWDTPASFRDTLTVIRNHILEFSRTLPEMRFDTAGNTGDPHRKSSGGLPAGSPSPCLQSDFTSSPNRFLLHPQSHFNAFSIL